MIKGIGPKNAKIIERLCGKYIVDLLFHKPAAYIDRRNSPKIIDLEEVIVLQYLPFLLF